MLEQNISCHIGQCGNGEINRWIEYARACNGQRPLLPSLPPPEVFFTIYIYRVTISLLKVVSVRVCVRSFFLIIFPSSNYLRQSSFVYVYFLFLLALTVRVKFLPPHTPSSCSPCSPRPPPAIVSVLTCYLARVCVRVFLSRFFSVRSPTSSSSCVAARFETKHKKKTLIVP